MTQSLPAAAVAKSLQSWPTLCDRIDGSPPGSAIPGILQARTLEWVAISFSNAWKWKWSRSVVSDSLRPHGLQPTRLLRPWDFPGKSTGVACHCLIWKTGWRFLKELNIEIPYDLAIPLLAIYLGKKGNTNEKRYMHPRVHSSTIYNSQDIEATQVPINSWLD